jgi:hypothetical protein
MFCVAKPLKKEGELASEDMLTTCPFKCDGVDGRLIGVK